MDYRTEKENFLRFSIHPICFLVLGRQKFVKVWSISPRACIACKFYFLKFLFKSHLSLFVSKNKSRIGIKGGRGNGKNKISLYIHTSNPSPLYFIEHPIERFNPSCQIPPVHKTRNRIAQHPWKRWNTPSTSSTSFFFLFLSRLPAPSQPQSFQSYHSARHANSREEKFSLLENNGIFR